MIKRGFVLISMLVLLILAASFPAAAQDETPEAAAAPPVCTADELKQIIAQVGQINGKISDAAAAGNNAQTADQLTTALVAWGDTYQTYFSGIYTGFPQCMDGVIMADTLGFVLTEQMTLSSAALLNVDQSDPDITKAISDLAAVQGKFATSMTAGFTSIGKSVAAGNASQEWLPACTQDQLTAASALDDVKQSWLDQVPVMQTYLSDGTVDKTAYLALAKAVGDYDNLLTAGNFTCAEIYRRIANYIFVLNESLTMMNIGAAANSVSDNADYTKLQTYFNNTIAGYITALVPTPEATEASS
jgi:hypothetical protein